MALDPHRYQDLLGCLLDGELSDAQAEELGRILATEPGLLVDFRQHLVLWDLWAQQTTPERSADSFLAAWRTRLGAEAGAEEFQEAVRTKLEATASPREPSQLDRPGPSWWKTWRVALHRPVGLAWTAAMTIAVFAGVFWLASPRSAQATVTIHGEAVCTACVLHQTHDCHPAIRATVQGVAKIYYLEPTEELARMQGKFCRGPARAVAVGKEVTRSGMRLFETDSITIAPGQKPPTPPPKKDERVLFPF